MSAEFIQEITDKFYELCNAAISDSTARMPRQTLAEFVHQHALKGLSQYSRHSKMLFGGTVKIDLAAQVVRANLFIKPNGQITERFQLEFHVVPSSMKFDHQTGPVDVGN